MIMNKSKGVIPEFNKKTELSRNVQHVYKFAKKHWKPPVISLEVNAFSKSKNFEFR